MLIKNKKASLQVVVFVILSFLVVFSSLFVFYNSSKNKIDEMSEIGLMNNLLVEKNLFETYARDILSKALYTSYNEFSTQGKYIENPSFDSNLNIIFQDVNENLKQDFSVFFEKNMLDLFNKNFSNYYLRKLSESVKSGNYDFYFDGENVFFNFSRISLEENSDKIKIIYTPLITSRIGFLDLGLDNFEKIYLIKENCTNFDSRIESEICFNEKLKNFNVSISEIKISDDKVSFFVFLETKKYFLINNQKQKIFFDFIIV